MMKTTTLPISSPFDLMKERGFKESNINKFKTFLSERTEKEPLSLKQQTMSEVMFDDILNKKVLLYSQDLIWEYENSIRLTMTKDNVGFWAGITALDGGNLSCTPNTDA